MSVAWSANEALGQPIIYVDDDATGANNGSSWADAFVTVQDAISGAVAGDQVWVAEGIYYPDDVGVPLARDSFIALEDGVELYGGFAGNETALTERDFQTNISILSGDLLSNDAVINCSSDAQCAGAGGERCWKGACIRKAMIDDNSYTVVAADGVGAGTVLDGFVITGGNANGPPGGGAPVRETYGAGMYIFYLDGTTPVPSEPVIRNCRFEWNTASDWGGAIFVQAPPDAPDGPFIHHCTFVRNSSYQAGPTALPLGGAICSFDTDTRVEDCAFEENVAFGGIGGGGGAIGTQDIVFNPVLGRFPAMRISRCTFIANLADGVGGAMYDSHNDTVFHECTFIENQSGQGGGYTNVGGTPTVVNSIFIGNKAVEVAHLIASSSGGGMAMPGSDRAQEATVVNCLFLGNIATDMGGGFYWKPLADTPAERIIENTIFRGNTAAGVPNQIEVDATPDLAPTVTFCNIEGGWTNGDCPAAFPACNIDADPMFTAPGSGDYRLAAGSPCIDAGDNDIVLSLPVDTDIEGLSRRADDCDVTDTGHGDPPIVDIGPHEAPACARLPIPAVSLWGLVVLVLALLVIATIQIVRSRRPTKTRLEWLPH